MGRATKEIRPAAMGMLVGTVLGSGIGVLAFVFTTNPLAFTLVGLGTAFGLIGGAMVEAQRERRERS